MSIGSPLLSVAPCSPATARWRAHRAPESTAGCFGVALIFARRRSYGGNTLTHRIWRARVQTHK